MSKESDSKIQLSLKTFGIIIGAVGILHGIPEIIQGSSIVQSNSITALPENWPNSELYTLLQGQPANSILTGIPFYLLGVLAILISTALIIHSLFFIQKKSGLLIFALLNIGIALFGAGTGTPIMMGIPLLIFAIVSKRYDKKKERSESANKLNQLLFRIFYGLQVFCWILFFPGFVIISSLGEIPQPLFLFDFMIMPISILGALIFGLRFDNTILIHKNYE